MKIGELDLYRVTIGSGCEGCIHYRSGSCELGFDSRAYDYEDVNFFNVVNCYAGVRSDKNPCNHSKCETLWRGISAPVMPRDGDVFSKKHPCASVTWVLNGKQTGFMNARDMAWCARDAVGDPRAALFSPVPRILLSDRSPRMVTQRTIGRLNVEVWSGDISFSFANALLTTSSWTFFKLAGAGGQYVRHEKYSIKPGPDSILHDEVQLLYFRSAAGCSQEALSRWMRHELASLPPPPDMVSVAMTGLSRRARNAPAQIRAALDSLPTTTTKLELWDIASPSEWASALEQVVTFAEQGHAADEPLARR